MKVKKFWVLFVVGTLLSVSLACASPFGPTDQELLEGNWKIANKDSIVNDDPDGGWEEEFMNFDLRLTFGPEDQVRYEMVIFIDFNGLLLRDLGGDDIQLAAEPLEGHFIFSGTYEIVDQVILMNNIVYTTTPEQYCFSVNGEQDCSRIDEIFDSSDTLSAFGNEGGGHYEISETSLVLWDDDCNYPEDQTCAYLFTR